MHPKTHRPLLRTTLCATVGAILGAVAGVIQLRPCNTASCVVVGILAGIVGSAIIGLMTPKSYINLKDLERMGGIIVDPLADLFAAAQHATDMEQFTNQLKAALRPDPTDAMAVFRLATWLDWHERNAEAIPYLEAVVAAHPNDPNNMNQLAWAFTASMDNLSAGNVAKAEDLVRRAKLSSQNIPFATDTRAWLLYRQGKNEEALNCIQPILILADTTLEIAYHGAVICNALQDYRRALRLAEMTAAANRPFCGQAEAARLLKRLQGTA